MPIIYTVWKQQFQSVLSIWKCLTGWKSLARLASRVQTSMWNIVLPRKNCFLCPAVQNQMQNTEEEEKKNKKTKALSEMLHLTKSYSLSCMLLRTHYNTFYSWHMQPCLQGLLGLTPFWFSLTSALSRTNTNMDMNTKHQTAAVYKNGLDFISRTSLIPYRRSYWFQGASGPVNSAQPTCVWVQCVSPKGGRDL